ncbi:MULTISPECIES: VPLPA-CTERM sorting domain-containing protein [Actibacterium]|uniref:PEP-CTERM protein-sorting domain-containing protein n=1 Tax=Actibacterium naphthalenivorans TaxID=1614693 RepID=A0A840CBA6_9RHOB|nr:MULTISPECIES: VPLPA-CTERM sorting domain-containing protein [Actibacterium]ALG89509.1 hypothetical protein TQ29_04045 [Actibacterium sp. EMB200-NS6]MBB4020848.1 hypothetical protein [Actibacterium naphthalenivorans]
MKKFLSALFAAGMVASAADASVVGGTVTFGPGSFVELDSTVPMTIGQDNFDTPDLYALNELQDYTLGVDLVIDGGVIGAGTKVSSHYVGFDPLFWSRQGGSVSFSGKILGVISTTDTLLASDFLGAPAVSYTAAWERGLEPNWDKYSISDKTVSVSWWAISPGDYMRVITAAAVPVPAGGLLLVGALGSLAAVRRRRKSA